MDPTPPPMSPATFSWKWFSRLSLRAKTLAIGLGLISVILALGAGIQLLGRQGFNRVEAQHVIDHVERVDQVFRQAAQAMERYVRDYAMWDDSYRFVSEPSQKFIEDNFSHDVLANLNLSHTMIFNTRLQLVVGRSLTEDGQGIEASEGPIIEVAASAAKDLLDGNRDTVSGFLRAGGSLYLVALGKIYPTRKVSPANGVFVHIRLVDRAVVQEFASILRVELGLRMDEGALTRLLPTDRTSRAESFILEGTADALRVGIPLRDLRGQVMAVAETTLSRDIQQQARQFITLVWITLGAALLAISLLWPLTMRWFVLRRVERIHAFVAMLGQKRALTDRLPVREGDELDALALGVNQTLDALEAEQRLRDESEARSLRLQEQLVQVQKMEAVATMAGGIAHDFNNSLNAIMGSLELVRDDLPADHPAQRHLERIQKAGSGACALAKQMLNLSRSAPVQKTAFHLGEALSDVLRLVRAGLPKSIEIHFRNEAADDVVLADHTQLQQVVMNLATNASHAMASQPSGHIEVRVREVALPGGEDRPETLTLPPGSYLRLEFSDNGHGIEKEILGKVFDPFFTTKPAGSGTGLGLAVAQGFVTRHGGSLGIDSVVGKGTTFVMHLPRHHERVSPQSDADSLRILLVDDDTHGRETLAEGLRRNGHQVTEVTNGDLALKLVQQDSTVFDVIVTDQIMPGMTGMDLCTAVLAHAPKLPIVLISGYTGPVDPASLKVCGIREFFVKPVGIHELDQALRRLKTG